MRRIRAALLLVFLALLVPAVVLAWRALEGLSVERAVRHQVVAERAFDEMERALSGFLEREEARPFEHYRFYLPGGDARSPLARGEVPPFVVGAFQIDPDGSVHTPLRPRDLARARVRGDWPPAPEALEAIARVTAVARDAWRAPAAPAADEDAAPGAREERAAGRQAPGTTRPVGGLLADRVEELARADAKESASAYEVIGRFNRGAQERALRKQKVAAVPEAEVLAGEAAPALRSGDRRVEAAEGDALREAPGRPAFQGLGAPMPTVAGEPRPAAQTAPRAAERAPARADAPAVRVVIDPMVGRAGPDGTLLLSRTVLVGAQGVRQGLVLDREALGDWLARRTLAASGLSRLASVRFDGGSPDAPEDAFEFEHRFAEPFDALSARLALTPLPGVSSPGAVYGLLALLLAVGAAGLLAVHRMVSVVVDFAERRSRFVSAVTHELKTPLTAIRMYAEMLRDGLVGSDAKRAEYYGTITDESERLSRLIDNVLEFSRLERDQREMHFQVGPVGPVLEEAARTLRAHAERRGFALELAVEPGLPAIRFDRDALLQVLFNLVDNAMKYAGADGARRVVLRAERRDGDVVVSVRDFGPGVPVAHLGRIFEPFYRVEDGRAAAAKGTGIGLALVEELAARMGAAVRGTNAEDGGFRVSLAFAATRPD